MTASKGNANQSENNNGEGAELHVTVTKQPLLTQARKDGLVRVGSALGRFVGAIGLAAVTGICAGAAIGYANRKVMEVEGQPTPESTLM